MIDEKQQPPILPFKIHSGLELMNTAPEKIPCLVDDLLLQVGVSMLSAKPKTGKSMLARQLSGVHDETCDAVTKRMKSATWDVERVEDRPELILHDFVA